MKAVLDVEASFRDMSLHKALIAVWDFINITNKYIVENEPWSLAKDPANGKKLTAVMYDLLSALHAIAVMLSPFMPQTAEKILRQIGCEKTEGLKLDDIKTDNALKTGQVPDPQRCPVPAYCSAKRKTRGSESSHDRPQAGNRL